MVNTFTVHQSSSTIMISLLKMHGLGNDFVVLDNREGKLPALDWQRIADRHKGVGCDQVVVLEPSAKADIFMRIYNADGSEVESCGNASRCVAWLLASPSSSPWKGEGRGEGQKKQIRIETRAGVIEAQVESADSITMDMGMPRLGWKEIPLKEKKDTLNLRIGKGGLKNPVAVNIGNPHMVFFVSDSDAVPLAELGPALERHPLFPRHANVGVAQVMAKDSIRLRVWERGAGMTLACGTGACAALVAAHRRGLTGRKAIVHLPGGSLHIEWREEDGHVLMTGPAAVSFRGTLEVSAFSV